MRTDRVLSAGLAVFGVYHLALGALMATAPGTFFAEIGPFGPRNDHYIRDTATYNLAFGVALLLALGRPAWRVPVVGVVVLQFALHTLNHLLDIGAAEPRWIGLADFLGLLLATLLLVALLLRARRERDQPAGVTGAGGGPETAR